MNTPTYTWVLNKDQPGTQTEEGNWHSVPHPYLDVQHPYCVLNGLASQPAHSVKKYWHPDYVLFKGKTQLGSGWYISQRTAGGIDPGHHGPFKTKGMAKRAVLGGD
jgi:hypothetical protein